MEKIVGPARLLPVYTMDWAKISKTAMADAFINSGRGGHDLSPSSS